MLEPKQQPQCLQMKVDIASWHASLCTPATYQGQVDLKYHWEEPSITSPGHSYSANYLHGHNREVWEPKYIPVFLYWASEANTRLSIGIGSAAKVVRIFPKSSG